LDLIGLRGRCSVRINNQRVVGEEALNGFGIVGFGSVGPLAFYPDQFRFDRYRIKRLLRGSRTRGREIAISISSRLASTQNNDNKTDQQRECTSVHFD